VTTSTTLTLHWQRSLEAALLPDNGLAFAPQYFSRFYEGWTSAIPYMILWQPTQATWTTSYCNDLLQSRRSIGEVGLLFWGETLNPGEAGVALLGLRFDRRSLRFDRMLFWGCVTAGLRFNWMLFCGCAGLRFDRMLFWGCA